MYTIQRVSPCIQETERMQKHSPRKCLQNSGVGIHIASTAKEAVSGARIMNTITNSSDPIFSLKDLRGEFHVNLAGANLPSRREVEKDVLESSDIIIVEHFD